MGHKSGSVGRAFEGRVQNAIIVAQQQGLVRRWEHAQPQRSFGGKMIKPAGADFSLILRGGLSGAVECKTVQGPRFYRSEVTPTEAAHLEACADGGLGLLALEFRDDVAGICAQRLVPWRKVPWYKVRTAESVDLAQLSEWVMSPDASLSSHLRVCNACDAVLPVVTARGCCGFPF